eukprot:GHVP01029712.1.p1 GENE.GHVP01029712.1~~GHVP01029712.1.p1  ORF type:complete len:767 (+),score=193.89 GHVP01029712.1:550-2850(+)
MNESSSKDNIKVYLRIKPLLNGQNERPRIEKSNDSIIITGFNDGRREAFSYDGVGDDKVTQKEVFEKTSLEITTNFLDGYNGTVFAYGQTGSGKTYTMQGTKEQQGIIPRVIEHMFDQISIRKMDSNRNIETKCSYIEIYNETIYDLLSEENQQCILREDGKKGVYIEGCKQMDISAAHETMEIFEKGAANRRVGETRANRESSRSHSVFTIYLCETTESCGVTDRRDSQFNLVDLAGSERQQSTGTVGIRLKEAGSINRSLFSLGNVINSLVEISNGQNRHVHYRDSKLTFLLRDSFGGNARTVLIANVNQSNNSLLETLSTLKFAQRAKMIKNKAIINEDVSGGIEELKEEIKRLRARKGECLDDEKTKFILQMSLSRQREAERNYENLKEKQNKLEELLKKKDKQIQAEKLIVRLRENALRVLREGNENPNDKEKQYLEEIECLKKQLILGEKVTSLEYERMVMKGQLNRLDEYLKNIESYDNDILKMQKYQENLIDRIANMKDVEVGNKRIKSEDNNIDEEQEDATGEIKEKKTSRSNEEEGPSSQENNRKLHEVITKLNELITKHRFTLVEKDIMGEENQYLKKQLMEKEDLLNKHYLDLNKENVQKDNNTQIKHIEYKNNEIQSEKEINLFGGNSSGNLEYKGDGIKSEKEINLFGGRTYSPNGISIIPDKKESNTKEEICKIEKELIDVKKQLEDTEMLHRRIKELEEENRVISQHKNIKQKIQHLYDVKQENNMLQEKLKIISEDNMRLKNLISSYKS